MSIDLSQDFLSLDFFALFGLPRRYQIDEAALDAVWHELQSQVHPDRYAHLPDVEKRLSMQWATRVNEAYRTLKKPLARAQYLLQLSGIDTALETNTIMSPAFLMEQMEWREAVEEARAAGEVTELDRLHQRLLVEARAVRAELAHQLDDQAELVAAADTVRRLMFIEKLQHESDEALLALED